MEGRSLADVNRAHMIQFSLRDFSFLVHQCWHLQLNCIYMYVGTMGSQSVLANVSIVHPVIMQRSFCPVHIVYAKQVLCIQSCSLVNNAFCCNNRYTCAGVVAESPTSYLWMKLLLCFVPTVFCRAVYSYPTCLVCSPTARVAAETECGWNLLH